MDKLLGSTIGGCCLDSCFAKDALVEFATPRSKKRSSKPTILTMMLQVKQLYECYHSFKTDGGKVVRLEDKRASWSERKNLKLWAAFVRLCEKTHQKWNFEYHDVDMVPPVGPFDCCLSRREFLLRKRLVVTDGDDVKVVKNGYSADKRECRVAYTDAPEKQQAGSIHVCEHGHYMDIYNKDLLSLLNHKWVKNRHKEDPRGDRLLLESVMLIVQPFGLAFDDVFVRRGGQVVPQSTNAFSKFVLALWLAKGLVKEELLPEEDVAVKFRYVGKDPVQGRAVMELMEAKVSKDGVPKWRSLSLEMLRRGVIYGNIMSDKKLRTREDHMERENYVEDYAIANTIGRIQKVEHAHVNSIVTALLQSKSKENAVDLLTNVLMNWPVRQVLAKNLTQEHPGLYKRRVYGPDSDLGGSLPVRKGTNDDSAVFCRSRRSRSRSKNQQTQYYCCYCHNEDNEGHHFTEGGLVTPGNESDDLLDGASSEEEEGQSAPRGTRFKTTSCDNLKLQVGGKASQVPCWLPVQVWRHLTECAAYNQKEREYNNILLHSSGKTQSILNWNVEKAKAKLEWQELLVKKPKTRKSSRQAS